MVKNEDGTLWRGYTLATLRTRLDSAGLLLSQEAPAALQVHDVALCRPLREQAPVLRAGDLLREARGFIDGATVSHVKRQRRVDIIRPLKANMWVPQAAIALAELTDQWEPHPSRGEQEIAFVRRGTICGPSVTSR